MRKTMLGFVGAITLALSACMGAPAYAQTVLQPGQTIQTGVILCDTASQIGDILTSSADGGLDAMMATLASYAQQKNDRGEPACDLNQYRFSVVAQAASVDGVRVANGTATWYVVEVSMGSDHYFIASPYPVAPAGTDS